MEELECCKSPKKHVFESEGYTKRNKKTSMPKAG